MTSNREHDDSVGAYHVARKSGNFGFKSNGKVIFRKFCSEIEEYLQRGCLPFVRINRLGRALNNGKGFSKISKSTERNSAYHLHFDFP